MEVLRDGAAAQYGSDAIAGVINIILRRGANGGELAAGAGQYTHGDGAQSDLSANLGHTLGAQGWIRLSAEQHNADQTNRAGFEGGPAAALDPRAFQFSRMTVPQRQTYARTLSAADLATVKKSYNAAVQGGLIGGDGN